MNDIHPGLAELTFGEILRLLRHRAKLSLKSLGSDVGLDESTLSRIESSTRLPPGDKIRDFARVLARNPSIGYSEDEMAVVLERAMKHEATLTAVTSELRGAVLRAWADVSEDLETALVQYFAHPCFKAHLNLLGKAQTDANRASLMSRMLVAASEMGDA